MPLVIEQYFLTGRFNATRWKQSPFEDLHGEWPPSPWRLLRTLAARWFEHLRETSTADTALRDRMLSRLADEPPYFHLPPNASHSSAWPSRGLKQYQPTALVKSDKKRGEPWVLRHQTTLVVDSFACVPPSAPVRWIWPSLSLQPDEESLLDELLRRVTYFGRAESLCLMRRAEANQVHTQSNCELQSKPGTGSPVLVADPNQPLRLDVLLANSDDSLVSRSAIPPGTVWWYARRPAKPLISPKPRVRERPPVSMFQFALGGRVFPPRASWIRITERFRGTVLDAVARLVTGGATAKFRDLPAEEKGRFSLLTGKGADGKPLKGHAHFYLWLLPDRAGKPTRLVCYRRTPFDAVEQEAMLAASERPLSWQFGNPDWMLRVVPLPPETPLPADISARSRHWRSATAYVPSRHVFGRNGKPKPGNSVAEQLLADLANAGFPKAKIQVAESERKWAKVHQPKRTRNGATNDLKLGYDATIEFPEPVEGPIALGHSAHFGLGLFVPIAYE